MSLTLRAAAALREAEFEFDASDVSTVALPHEDGDERETRDDRQAEAARPNPDASFVDGDHGLSSNPENITRITFRKPRHQTDIREKHAESSAIGSSVHEMLSSFGASEKM